MDIDTRETGNKAVSEAVKKAVESIDNGIVVITVN